jgi:hypothetical protein
MEDDLRKQDKHLEALELAALKRILKTLAITRSELIALISETNGFDQAMMLTSLQAIDRMIEELRIRLDTDFDEVLREASRTGVTHQTEILNKFFGGQIPEQSEYALFGSVELVVLKALEMNVDTFLVRFSASIRERVKNVIQQAFIHGRNEGEAITQIKEQFKTQLAPTQRAVHHIYQTAYNTANHEVLLELEKSAPGIKKQWYSEMDKRTTDPCKNLHLQIRNIQDPFEEPDSGSLFMFPPAVFGNESLNPAFHLCRSRAIPYFEDVQ